MLLVAAGGGGDAITAVALAPLLGINGIPVVLTYSWDRLLIDPLPGPRAAGDFAGLHQLAPNVHEVLPTTTPRPPAGSALPRLANELPARFLLLDPTDGATGMTEQISAAARHFGDEELALVDVGGDILARGAEPQLRSPLADLLALAACTATGLPCQLLIVGPGIDGEIDQPTLHRRLTELHATHTGNLGPHHIAPIRHVFDWHPSEATGLLAAVANGERGRVETRDAANHIHLTDESTAIYRADAYQASAQGPAADLPSTTSLTDASLLVTDATGTDEIGYETTKASHLGQQLGRLPTAADLPAIDHHATAAAHRGATHITARRLAELTGMTTADGLDAFQQLLAAHRPERYHPPLYRVSP